MKQSYLIFFISLAMLSCEGPEGAVGPQGIQGIAGENGTDGINGRDGADGANGADGADGATGPQGPAGPPGFANVERIEKVFKFNQSTKISDWHRYWSFTDDKITDEIHKLSAQGCQVSSKEIWEELSKFHKKASKKASF